MKTPEEIKKGLECCACGNMCRGYCPYDGGGDGIYGCTSELSRDAIALIHQLEAKLAKYEKPLVPLPEVQIYNDPVWLEMRAEGVDLMIADIVPSFDEPGSKAEIMLLGNARRAHLLYAHYGSSWRCWPRKPTDEERKAAKWGENGQDVH